MHLIGRRSSLFTRMPLFFVEELGLACDFSPIPDMTQTVPGLYAGNPALKLPILEADGNTVFGAQNICRVLAEKAAAAGNPARIVWPEELRDAVSRNAQELVWHCMGAQVALVMGTVIGKLPVENIYFAKGYLGLEGSLAWLDANLEAALQALPTSRNFSLFEVSLFCLIEHLAFRPTAPLAPHPRLVAFAAQFGTREAARRTAYRFD
jgi:glutathione S-transferase